MTFIRQYKIKIILIIIITTSCGYFAYLSTPKYKYQTSIPKIDPNTFYVVTDVLDGDTFEVKIGKEKVTIRMLGIDTPETLDPRKPVQCYGKESSEEAKKLLDKREVKLVIDKTQYLTDKYGRILAYVYRDDGLFINKFLLEKGFAREYTYSKAYELQEEFREIEQKSKIEKEGLWSTCAT